MKYRCLIVDDEPLARGIIEKYISELPSLKVVKSCKNAFEAISFLHTNNVDILFLDIKMPDLTGLDMLKTLVYKPSIIITTAYSEYAVESYEYEVTDYLLKPISFEKFIKAVNKVLQKKNEQSFKENEQEEPEHIFLKSDKTTYKINFSEIKYIEAFGNYIKIFLPDQKIMIYETMASFEGKLPNNFLRVHKSYIIPVNNINKLEGNTLYIDKIEIPVGKVYRKTLIDYIKIFPGS